MRFVLIALCVILFGCIEKEPRCSVTNQLEVIDFIKVSDSITEKLKMTIVQRDTFLDKNKILYIEKSFNNNISRLLEIYVNNDTCITYFNEVIFWEDQIIKTNPLHRFECLKFDSVKSVFHHTYYIDKEKKSIKKIINSEGKTIEQDSKFFIDSNNNVSKYLLKLNSILNDRVEERVKIL